MNDSQRVFRLASTLLQYPEEDWVRSDIIKKEIFKINNGQIQESLLDFVKYLDTKSIEELAIHYVETFDFNDRTTLYLTYSELGEEKERGKKLAELKEIYEQAECVLASTELPDYFPLMLEFMAIAPKSIANQLINEYLEEIKKLASELEKNQNPYKLLFQAAIMIMEHSNEIRQSGGAS